MLKPAASFGVAMKSFAVAGFVLALLLLRPATAAEGYALYTQWDDTKLGLAACKDKGERALHAASFKTDTERTANSVYARRAGGYTAGIRCVESKQMVIFVISGPQGSIASKYLDEIVHKF
jgi:hypothetical protein